MAQALTDIRIAQSFIGLGAAGVVESKELDFNLGSREAIEIFQIDGICHNDLLPEPVVATRQITHQSVHMDDDLLTAETPAIAAAAADLEDFDSDVLFDQRAVAHMVVDAAASHAGFALDGTHKTVTFAQPIVSPVNLSHFGDPGAILTGAVTVFIHHRIILLSDSELGLAFARRRR